MKLLLYLPVWPWVSDREREQYCSAVVATFMPAKIAISLSAKDSIANLEERTGYTHLALMTSDTHDMGLKVMAANEALVVLNLHNDNPQFEVGSFARLAEALGNLKP